MDLIEILATRGGFHMHGGPPLRPNFVIRTTDEELAQALARTFTAGRLNGPYRYNYHHDYWVWRVRGDALTTFYDAVIFRAPAPFLDRLAAAIEQDRLIKKTMPGRGRGKREKHRQWRVDPERLVRRA